MPCKPVGRPATCRARKPGINANTSERYRFNYGRKWHLERMPQSQIRLPANTDDAPDFAFMEAYVRRLPFGSQL